MTYPVGVVSLLVLAVGAGLVAGTLLGGRTADRFVGRGRLDGRLLVALVTRLRYLGGVATASVSERSSTTG